MHRLAGMVHRGARERHPMFPADQRSDAAPCRFVHAERRAIAAAPDQPLTVRRHQLAVTQRRLGGTEQILRVEQAAAHPLMRADRDEDAGLIDQRLQRRQSRVVLPQRLVEQDGVQRLRALMLPDRRARGLVEP